VIIMFDCKFNYVYTVNEIMPKWPDLRANYEGFFTNSTEFDELISTIGLTLLHWVYIIIFTYTPGGAADAPKHVRRPKNKQPARRRNPQSATEIRIGPPVCLQRFLRPPRSGASEVRDGTKSKNGRAFCFRCGESIRIFEARFLPGKSRIRLGRFRRPGTYAPRTQESSQANGRGNGICARIETNGPSTANCRDRHGYQATLRHRRSSANNRARARSREKKTVTEATDQAIVGMIAALSCSMSNCGMTPWLQPMPARRRAWPYSCLKECRHGCVSGRRVSRASGPRLPHTRPTARRVVGSLQSDLPNTSTNRRASLLVIESRSPRY